MAMSALKVKFHQCIRRQLGALEACVAKSGRIDKKKHGFGLTIKMVSSCTTCTDAGLVRNHSKHIEYRGRNNKLSIFSLGGLSRLVVLVMLIFVVEAVPVADAWFLTTPAATTTRILPLTVASSLSSPQQPENVDIASYFHTRTALGVHNGKSDHSLSTLDSSSATAAIPQHVAMICDGNSRWAQARGLAAAAGHVAGADRLVQVLETLQDMGVSYCTLYAFSTENWQRPAAEIAQLWQVMEQTARRFRHEAISRQARIRILGDLDDPRIPASLRQVLRDIETETARTEPKQTVCLAINYGGRRDILQAAKRLAEDIAHITDHENTNAMDDIKEDDFAAYLGTTGIPDPDLIIRTSGEHRLSNFLLWNAAYAEIYFTDILWPDFDAQCVAEALSWYAQRQRRFGSREKVGT